MSWPVVETRRVRRRVWSIPITWTTYVCHSCLKHQCLMTENMSYLVRTPVHDND